MAKLKTYSEFVNEGFIDAIKNPIKWKKIKNNAKAYQKAKVAQALNDVDYAKRLEKASGELSPEQREVLTQASKAKNAALTDTASNISQRMDDLATTPGLQQVAKLAKTKSNLAANAIVLIAADGEEAKRLKIKQNVLTKKATDIQKALADYESDRGEEKKDSAVPKEATPEEKDTAQTTIDTAKTAYDAVKDGDDHTPYHAKAKLDAELKFKQAQQKKAKLDGNDELFQGLGDDIGAIIQKIKDLDTANVPESFSYVAESISRKFARLRSNL